jgi:protein-S-isoprenylcysteine O-methyltransferase Ste14
MRKVILPDECFIVFLALATLFHFIFPIQRIIFYPYNFIGIIIIAIGIIITLVVNFLLLKSETSIKPYEPPSALVISGPFKYSRNPLYLGMAATLFGIDILFGSISPFIFSILFIIIIDRFLIPMEEKSLKNIFLENYTEYKKRVRRWI